VSDLIARWRDWSGEGLEDLLLNQGKYQTLVESIVIGQADDQTFALAYRIECDDAWRTKTVIVWRIGDAPRIELRGDGVGNWQDFDGNPLPALDGTIDVDITATPFTNTLPIRRLGLEAGQSADIVVAYIDVPSLTVTADPQRYTCLEPMRRYRFESLDSEFKRNVEVDEHGLVVLYPGLFKRVL
jgi:hypothetical protein